MRQRKLQRATYRRFDTIPACDGGTDGQTDGIAVANTALAMGALRRAVKTRLIREPYFRYGDRSDPSPNLPKLLRLYMAILSECMQ